MSEAIRVTPRLDHLAAASYLSILPGLIEADVCEPTEMYSIDGSSYEVGQPLPCEDSEDTREWLGSLVVVRPIDVGGNPLVISRHPRPEEDRIRWKRMEQPLVQQEITSNRAAADGRRFSPKVGRLVMASTTMRNIVLLDGRMLFTGFYRNEARTPTHALYPVLKRY